MTDTKTVAFHTLGCKLNFAETATIARSFRAQGYVLGPWDGPADLYVINTCSVTENANRKCRKAIRHARHRAPGARIVVVGCYAQLKPDEIAAMPRVDVILGTRDKFSVTEYVQNKADGPVISVSDLQESLPYHGSVAYGSRTRAFLKVQDGCDYSCSYCTIPLARGQSRSDTIANVVANARELGERGIREVVLTGVNTADFGLDARGERVEHFVDLLRSLDQVEEVERIRISSVEPNLLSGEIIELVASSRKLMPHFHLPLQSGSDRILKGMRRRYLTSLYANRFEEVKRMMPHCCIGADVITGFPGETESDFLESYRFLADLDVSYLHVFPYSERPNTAAASMGGSVPLRLREERAQSLRNLSLRKRRQFYTSHLDTVRAVLFEESGLEGFTDNYIRVAVKESHHKPNSVAPVRLRSLQGDTVVAAEVEELIDA